MKHTWKLVLAAGLVLSLLAGCTTIGTGGHAVRNAGYTGEAEPLRLCVYKDSDITHERVDEIVAAMRGELAPFGLKVEVPWIREWQRPSFLMDGIIDDIKARPMECPCDRLLAVVGRDARDFAWGLILPEVLGGVESRTLTKGYVVGAVGSLNQALALQNPEDIAVHEAYHFLGCDHGLRADACYRQVADLRQIARQNREQGRDFFPAQSLKGKIFSTRAEVDQRLGLAASEEICPAG